MLITLLTLIILIILIIFSIPMIKCNEWYKRAIMDFEGLQWIFVALCAVVLIVEIVAILCVQIPKQHNYEAFLYEKEVLEYRLENYNDNIVGNELLYNDIVEFNQNLRCAKRYHNNLWTNWYVNGKIASVDYIDIKKIKGE